MNRKKRTHCFRGHELTEDNLVYSRSASGVTKRQCKQCDTAMRRARYPKPKGTKGTMARMNPVDRFMRQVEPIPIVGCWVWTGAITGEGYGQVMIDGRREKAHRAALKLLRGFDVASDRFVLHRCDVPACVNPEHLYVGTQSDNASDRERRGRGWNNRSRPVVSEVA